MRSTPLSEEEEESEIRIKFIDFDVFEEDDKKKSNVSGQKKQ